MQWTDRVYGDVVINDPDALSLIRCPTFQRLKGIRQAGPSAFAFPFKTVTRFEHSLGVYLLLDRLKVDRRQKIAGLVHDISHTAFSHAVDFLFHTHEQDYHERLKPEFLKRPDIASALRTMGFEPQEFYDDSIYPVLERPLPWLCADRLDYFLRDSMACGVSTPESVLKCLESVTVVDDYIAFTNAEAAQDAVKRFSEMNRHFWAGEIEAYIYNEFADAMRVALNRQVLREQDLLGDDAHVLSRLRASGIPQITTALANISDVTPARLSGFVPKIRPKTRWIDPPIVVDGRLVKLSQLHVPGTRLDLGGQR